MTPCFRSPTFIRFLSCTLLTTLLFACSGTPKNNLLGYYKTDYGNEPKPETGYAPVQGLQLYYEIHGASRAGQVPILLIHGGGSTLNTSFQRLIPALANERQVIAYDQQGHGRTADLPARPFTFSQSAKDAAALLEYLKFGEVDVMGYSNGGHIAIELALQFPNKIRRLILESAMVSRDGTEPEFWKGFKNAKLDQMPPVLRDEYLRTSPKPNLKSFFDKSASRMLNFKGWTDKQIASIQEPTLIILGDKDIVTPEHGAKMNRLLKVSKLAIIPDADHSQIVERIDWVAPLVLDFLR